jgi:Flp pilus assembly protein TadG
VEFAIVAILFFGMLYAIISLGFAWAGQQRVTNAAAVGARAAVGATNPVATAQARAVEAMGGPTSGATAVATTGGCSTGTTSTTSATTTTTTAASGGQCVTVTVTYPYKGPRNAPGMSFLLPANLKSTAVVQI